MKGVTMSLTIDVHQPPATWSPLVAYVGNRGDVIGSTPSVDRPCLRDPSPPTSGLSRYDSLVENHTRGVGGMHQMDNAVGHRARSSAGAAFSMLDGSVDFLKMLCGPACCH